MDADRVARPLTYLVAVALAIALLPAVPAPPAQAASPPLVPGESVGDDPDEEWWEGIVVPDTGVLPDAERHPSLYFSADHVGELRARATGEAADPRGYYAAWWDRISTDADAWLTEEVSANDDDKSRASKALALVWVITGDVAYRDKAVEMLTAAYDDIQETDQYVAMQMTNYAVAYDWVVAEGISDAPPIDPADDAAMRAAIKRGATWMHVYLDRPGVRSHNHRSKVAAAQGTWAMAFADDPDAQAYLDKGMANLRRVWRYMFTADGIHRDGAGYYWIFTVINSTPFLWHYRNAAGQDLFPLLQPAFEWQLKTSNPNGWNPNLEDGWYKTTWLHTVAAAYADTPTELSSAGTLGELFQWRFFDSDWAQVRYPDDFTGARNQYYGWADEFVLYDSDLAEVQPDGSGTVDFDAGPRGGATVFRSDWDRGEAHTRWAYFEGTAMSNNHDHADALQLLVDAENTILAHDNGYGPERFGGRNAWKGPEHHNVVTADGAALGDPEPTRHFVDTAFFDLAEKQAAYFDDPDATHVRAVAFPGQDYFVVADRLQASSDKTWVSRYHNRGEIEGAANRWTWTTTPGPWGDAARMHAFVLPAQADVQTAPGAFNPYGDGTFALGDPYPDPATDVEDTTKLEITQSGTSAQYLKVLVPEAVDGHAPGFHDLSAGDVLAARVDLEDARDHFLTQPEPAAASAGALGATATFAWVRAVSGHPQQLGAREASTVALDGTTLVEASAPVSLALDVGDPRRHHGQVARDTGEAVTLRVRLPEGRTLAAATLDGEPVEARAADGFAVVDLPAGGDVEITFTAADAAPVAPTGLEATPLAGRVDLRWDAAPSAYAYDVLRAPDGGTPEVVATVTAPAYTDCDVVDGTVYTYAVVARNEAGDSPPSDSVEATPGLRAPAAPDGLVAVPGDSQVSLAWNAVRDAERYLVLRDSGDGPQQVADVTATSHTDTGLDNGTTYTYTVVAANTAGESPPSAPVESTPFTEPPEAPNGVRSDRDETSVTLRWDAAERARSYSVGRATEPGGPYDELATGLDATSYTDTDVTPQETYYYVVTAHNSAGDSTPSREAVGIPGCTLHYEVDGTTETFVEAEGHAELSGDLEVHRDVERSGGAYVESAGGSGFGSAPGGTDYVRFDLHVTDGGDFRLWLLAQGDDSSSDSFWIEVDGQEPFQAIMHNSRQWAWKTAASAARLEGGFHTLKIHHREGGARVDKILLTKATDYTPSGLGDDAAEALDPECGPGGPGCTDAYPVDGSARTFVEAEAYSELSGDMHVVADAERSGGKFVEAGPSAPKDDPSTDAWIAYDLDVTGGGDFRVVALSYGPDSNSDSFYVAIDDAEPAAQINLPREWQWKVSNDRVTIPDGRVRLYLKARKAGSKVDKLLLTQDGHTPTGFGGEALPPPGCPDDEPDPPPAPTGLSARRAPGQVTLSWDPVADATSYTVLRTTDALGEPQPLVTDLAEPAYVDTDVTDATAYTYAVQAVGDGGASRRSATVTAVPGCTRHTVLDGTAVLEAEGFTARSGDVAVVEDEGRSDGAYLAVASDAAKGALADDWVRYDLEVRAGGDYAVWVLGYGAGSESSDSFWLQADGGELAPAHLVTEEWGWRSPGTVALTEGFHVLWLRNREPGAAADKLVLTVDGSEPPEGLGPDPTPPSDPACGDGTRGPCDDSARTASCPRDRR